MSLLRDPTRWSDTSSRWSDTSSRWTDVYHIPGRPFTLSRMNTKAISRKLDVPMKFEKVNLVKNVQT